MSELIQNNDNRATIRWKLLTTVSALVLAAYAADPARAEDADHPLLWIELGGQMEQVEGLSNPFTAPFMSLTPTPNVYNGLSFTGSQRNARYSFGEEAKITFQPENSNWNFSAGIRYGRSHANRHTHRQITHPTVHWVAYYYGSPYGTYASTFPASFADSETKNSERHAILDFTAGKDVGLGMFGRQSSSTINAGVRIASFTAKSTALMSARPEINVQYYHLSLYSGVIQGDVPYIRSFHQYTMHAQASRSFKGIGPSLSWNASAAIAGDAEHGELALDWGVNASVLFGRQRAETSHSTQAYSYSRDKYHHGPKLYGLAYHHAPPAQTRSRSVTVPNIGGFAALTAQFKDAKVSIGYRYDTFLNVMDTGIDTAKKSDLTFNGPYASISIGLGD